MGVRAEIQPFHGVPTLFVDGRPVHDLPYLRSREKYPGNEEAAEADHLATYAQQAGIGRKVFFFPSTCASDFYVPEIEVWHAPHVFDYGHVDRFMHGLLTACPDALVVPKVQLFAPEWWEDAYPEELLTFWDGRTEAAFSAVSGSHRTRVASPASQRWARDMTMALERYIQHLETHYADHVIGYKLCWGITHEWGILGSFDFVDYSVPMQRYWTGWLAKRYGPDAGRDACLPSREERLQAEGSFRNPAVSQRAIDFQLCLSDLLAERINHFGRVVKRCTGGRRFTAVYYGYTLTCREGGLEFLGRYGCGGFQGGHLALHKVLRDSAIDCITSPFSYNRRRLGTGDAQPHYPAHSVVRAGKMSLLEDDNRSWKGYAARGIDVGYYPDKNSFLQLLRRSFARRLCDQDHFYLMDLLGHNYDDPDVLDALRALQSLYEEHVDARRPTPAEVLVVVDEEAIACLGLHSNLHLQNVYHQAPAWGRMGTPYHVVLIDDTNRMSLDPYRMLVVANAVRRGEPLETLAARARTARRSVLFLPASGLIGPTGPHADHVSAVTGIRMQLVQREEGVHRARYGSGAGAIEYGLDRPMSHLLAPVDPQVEVLARLCGSELPALAVKGREGAFDAYASVAPLPAEALAALAARAGCRLWNAEAQLMYISRRMVALHASRTDTFTVDLPARCGEVRPVWCPGAWTREGRKLRMRLADGDTAVFRLA